MQVFIADDSAIVLDRLVSMISEIEGIDVVGIAQNGDSAIESIRELMPDVVILDIRMPGKGGIEVLHTIKLYDPAPCVIILTNYPHSQYLNECIKAGADFFFDKSNEFEKISRLLNRMIRESQIKKGMKNE